MDVFDLRRRLIADYADYVQSFIRIRDSRIRDHVAERLAAGDLWPEPLIQLNPAFEPGGWIDDLVAQGVLHPECSRIFRKDKDRPEEGVLGQPLRLHRHQTDAIHTAQTGANYVLTTGTGSGKSMAYVIPIVDYILRRGSGRGIQAIVVYPMNALANSQLGELTKFLCEGYPEGQPVTFARYTGQESDEERSAILANPPDILLTNFVMLELILTRPYEDRLVRAAAGLRFLVLDELHTYRGRQGADVALLVRRVRNRMSEGHLQCVGTSATLAGAGTYDEQRAEVAAVASQLFGALVRSEHVIGETLRRSTPAVDQSAPEFRGALRERILSDRCPPEEHERFVRDPLSIWIEGAFGVVPEVIDGRPTGRLLRRTPRGIDGDEGAAAELSAFTGVRRERCAEAVREGLLAGYRCEPDPVNGFRPFAFRLHQFISRGDTVYATIEPADQRYPTLQGQQFRPGSRDHLLLPLVFCRECGQEYYTVRRLTSETGEPVRYVARELSNRSDEDGDPGFLCLDEDNPWPGDAAAILQRIPDDWVEEHRGELRVRRDRRDELPQTVRVTPDGRESPDGIDLQWTPAPFRFCLHCGVSYNFQQSGDFAKLASLSSEGRSTATTILSLGTVRALREAQDLPPRARKLLSFTDNRQDASLQAGHFNDFVEVGLLRAALYRAACEAGAAGLEHDTLTQRVFAALNLPLELYLANPRARFQALTDAQRAFRNLLGYRLYRDLRRGWRVNAPNLEQCGLLEIQYQSLQEACAAEDLWEGCHPALVSASVETRVRIARVLLDAMRRELAIRVDYLDREHQERLQQQSSQHLVAPWSLDENEALEHSAVVYPRARRPQDYGGHVFLSARGGFGQFLRRESTFPEMAGRLRPDEIEPVLRQLLDALEQAGIVTAVQQAQRDDEVPGYQLNAAALRWVAGDGTRPFHDPITVPNPSTESRGSNAFFTEFYRTVASTLVGLEAREHTAQVPYEDRILREERFKEAQLPVLYCSPTMELGVDIAQLNVVNMRNIPPTPANYAQRSGRAGRSGQPALVFSYCSTGSPHDQYFFRRPEAMVAGAVAPPRLDLANEDLLRAHVQAIWLAETGQSLGTSLRDILDVAGERPLLALQSGIRDCLSSNAPRQRARTRAQDVLATLQSELASADWYHSGWLDEVLSHLPRSFDAACDRWRGLYRAALDQAIAQDRIIRNAATPHAERQQAERLRREAEAQLKLLIDVENVAQSDFYSYRYFASEGFLPGYNFPRLPLSAFIPARRSRQRDEFLSRPRFLAISEFGPRSIIYHEGSKYLIHKVILPVGEPGGGAEEEQAELPTLRAKLCEVCGYLHPVRSGDGLDQCERCGARLPRALTALFRLQNVATKRRDRINCDEEERLRFGYEIQTGVRFDESGGHPSCRSASLELGGRILGRLGYGHAATLWRVNLGWNRRRNREQLGFVLDVERGYWARNEQVADDEQDPMSPRTMRVIPFVEDRRNALLFEPESPLSDSAMASLQAALKNAIQLRFQLEENELAVEPLPNRDTRRLLLFYEASEGGAGVLRRLLDDPTAFGEVARVALELCHFDPETGEDRRQAPRAREDCEASCYDCLMSYANQRDHDILDRQAIRDVLLDLSQARINASPTVNTRAQHLEHLRRQCGSGLEREWLDHLDRHGHRLPSTAQPFLQEFGTRPDFLYGPELTAIYIDGPLHEYAERRQRDVQLTEQMEDAGYAVIRFAHADDWSEILGRYPGVFGLPQEPATVAPEDVSPTASSPNGSFDDDLEFFDPEWHPLVRTLRTEGIQVEPGGDVLVGSRVVGTYLAAVFRDGHSVRLLDGEADSAATVEHALQQDGLQTIAVRRDAPEVARDAVLRALG